MVGGLTVWITGPAQVESGAQVTTQLHIENESDHDVTDPDCRLGSHISGIVPADDPDAALWLRVIVDCGGPHTYPPGFSDVHEGPLLIAATMHGDPLSPGQYLASMEVDDGERISYEVEVVG